jgi:hypothetical protein
MHFMAPRACISDMLVLLFYWVPTRICTFINKSTAGSRCLSKHFHYNPKSFCRTHDPQRVLVRIGYNDIELAMEEDSAWRLWFFQLCQVFVLVTYITEDLIWLPKFFYDDLLLLLLSELLLLCSYYSSVTSHH